MHNGIKVVGAHAVFDMDHGKLQLGRIAKERLSFTVRNVVYTMKEEQAMRNAIAFAANTRAKGAGHVHMFSNGRIVVLAKSVKRCSELANGAAKALSRRNKSPIVVNTKEPSSTRLTVCTKLFKKGAHLQLYNFLQFTFCRSVGPDSRELYETRPNTEAENN